MSFIEQSGPHGRRMVALVATVGVAVLLAASVVAAPVRAAEACPNEQLRADNHSTELPDCRAYEQVTPSYKGAYEFVPLFVSGDGSRVFAESFATVAGSGANNTLGASYQLDRTSAGWATVAVSPPASRFPKSGYPDSPDESADGTTIWGTNEGQDDLFVHHPDGVFTTIGPGIPAGALIENEQGVEYVGASLGFSHVLFSINFSYQYWPFDTTEKLADAYWHSLYEYTGTGNTEPVLVGVSGGAGDHTLISQCGTSLGSKGSADAYNAVSSSGETVFFTAEHHAEKCSSVQPPVSELYARIGGESTVAISELTLPAGEECTGACAAARATPSEGVFQGASQDGSKVFFLTEQPLLNSDEDAKMDLYEAELEGEGQSAKVGRLVQVSHDPTHGQAAEVQGVARVSEDGSHVYFVAKGVLSEGPNAEGGEPTLGADNLYVYGPDPAHPGEFQTVFITTLSSSDAADWQQKDERPVQATPDGRFLLFQSVANLTGDAPDATQQLYRYDASDGELIRVSIGQEGVFNADGATGKMVTPSPGFSGVDSLSSHGPAISDDGSYVFFESEDGLTPNALNDVVVSDENNRKEYANNVYEWHEGNVYLISDGHDRTINFSGTSSVQLVGADPSGANVFFTTGDALSATDDDDLIDVYDARIDGGFPALVVPEPCSGDACQARPVAPSSEAAPGTPFFTGPGDLVSPPPVVSSTKPKAKPSPKCKRGFVEKKGKCVRKAKAKKKRVKARKAGDKRRAGS